jgi:ferredoxin-thioredoxin reductase catalytic subunit
MTMADSTQESSEEQRNQIVERLRKMVHRWPEVSGCYLQPDASVVEGVIQGLARSKLAHGFSYCP